MLLLSALLACPAPPPPAPAAEAEPQGRCGTQDDGSKVFVVLHVNDVARISGLIDGRGGLARVRTLRTQLEAECGGPVLVTNGGDLLYPSMLSREFEGAQMVDVLNRLDGDPAAVDPHLFVVFGNADFTRSKLKDATHMDGLLDSSEFTWLDTNVRWTPASGIEADSLSSQSLIRVHDVNVGIFGLTTDQKRPQYALIESDYQATAGQRGDALRANGAEVVLAVTHLDIDVERQLLRDLGQGAPDLLLGGQNQAPVAEQVDGRWLIKGAADAAVVQVAWVTVGADGAVTVDVNAVELGPDTVEDPAIQAASQVWWSAFDKAYCGDQLGCLQEQYATAGVDLIARETSLRSHETNFGSWVADTLRADFPDADAAIVNAGALRLNQDLLAGSGITRQLVEELLQYDNELVQIEVTGARMKQILTHAVTDYPSGHYLQVSGITYRHDVATGTISDLHRLTADGPVPVADDDTLAVVTVRFLVDPAMGDQDGFAEDAAGGLSMADVKVTGERSMKDVVTAGLKNSGEIAPEAHGRICTSTRPEAPCLVP